MRRTWVILLAAAFLGGCTAGPDYRRPELAVPENHRGLEGPAGEASLADVAWWDAVTGDEVLRGLIGEAIAKNQDLRVATARVEEFRAQAGIAKADYYPQLGYDATASRQKQPVPTVGFVYSPSRCKGIDVVLRAIEIARKQLGQLRVVSFGEGRPGAELLLPAEDFAVFVQQSGIGTDSVTDAISSFARSLSDGN